jgi:hypothetical protein
VRDAADRYGWRLVTGFADGFERHGYCSSDPWVVRVDESLSRQGDSGGALHPNRTGQTRYPDAIETYVVDDLYR